MPTLETKDSPVTWFVLLEDARRRADFRRAAQAQEHLARLGVIVKYRRPAPESRDSDA